MTPAYLKHQLGQSLDNMNLSCVDVYYIHNPNRSLARFHARSSTRACGLPSCCLRASAPLAV